MSRFEHAASGFVFSFFVSIVFGKRPTDTATKTATNSNTTTTTTSMAIPPSELSRFSDSSLLPFISAFMYRALAYWLWCRVLDVIIRWLLSLSHFFGFFAFCSSAHAVMGLTSLLPFELSWYFTFGCSTLSCGVWSARMHVVLQT